MDISMALLMALITSGRGATGSPRGSIDAIRDWGGVVLQRAVGEAVLVSRSLPSALNFSLVHLLSLLGFVLSVPISFSVLEYLL